MAPSPVRSLPARGSRRTSLSIGRATYCESCSIPPGIRSACAVRPPDLTPVSYRAAMTQVGGTVEPGFEGVKGAFERNFAEHGEVGAAFALHVNGKKVVDLWGGVADPKANRPYPEDSVQLVFSTTKGAPAMCANLLIEQGKLDPDAPVATYWPEFAQNGKENIPVRMLLCHQ